jgi:hypothetical protein
MWRRSPIPTPGKKRMPGKPTAPLTTMDHNKGHRRFGAIALAVARKLRRLMVVAVGSRARAGASGVFADASSLPLFGGRAVFSLGDP